MQKNAVMFRGLRERRDRGWSEEKNERRNRRESPPFLTLDKLCENPMNQPLEEGTPILVLLPSISLRPLEPFPTILWRD